MKKVNQPDHSVFGSQGRSQTKPHVVCLLWGEGVYLRTNAVLQSQALGQMKYLQSLGAHVTVICSDPAPAEFVRTYLPALEQAGITAIPVRQLEFRRLLIVRFMAFLTLRSFATRLKYLNQQHPIDIIYLRNFWNMFAVPDNKLKVLYDVRGINLEETIFKQKATNSIQHIKQQLYGFFESRAIQRATYLQCVSHPLKDYISEHFQRDDASVVHSCVEQQQFQQCRQYRDAIRKKFGIHDEAIVLLYSGGSAQYQELDFMLALWLEIAKRVEDAHFLLFLRDRNERLTQHRFFQSIAKQRVTITSVKHDEIPKHLSAADFGCLLRRDIALNRVASPVKFGEYLAAGLGIIASPGIGDISDFVQRHRIGTLVNPDDLAGGVQKVLTCITHFQRDKRGFSQRVQELGAHHFTWNAYKVYFLKRYFSL